MSRIGKQASAVGAVFCALLFVGIDNGWVRAMAIVLAVVVVLIVGMDLQEQSMRKVRRTNHTPEGCTPVAVSITWPAHDVTVTIDYEMCKHKADALRGMLDSYDLANRPEPR